MREITVSDTVSECVRVCYVSHDASNRWDVVTDAEINNLPGLLGKQIKLSSDDCSPDQDCLGAGGLANCVSTVSLSW